MDVVSDWQLDSDNRNVLNYFDSDERTEVFTNSLPSADCTYFMHAEASAGGTGGAANFFIYGLDGNNGILTMGTDVGGFFSAQCAVETSGSNIGRRTAYDIPLGVYHNLAITVEANASVNTDVKIYVNGVQADNSSASQNLFQQAGVLWIGSRFGSYEAKTKVGALLIWDRVLSLVEIQRVSEDYLRMFRLKGRIPVQNLSVPSAPPVSNEGAAMYHHLQNLGVY